MQKKLLSLLAIVLLLSLLLSTVLTSCASVADLIPSVTGGGTSDGSQSGSGTNTNPQQLQIFNTGLKLSQEQSLSRIKAEYLKENGGYKDDDVVVAIVSLSSPALIDVYLENERISSRMSLAEYAASSEGQTRIAQLTDEQNALIAELREKGLIDKVENTYTTILNGVAVSTKYGNFKKLSAEKNVSKTILSDTFNRPQSVKSSDASAIVNAVDIYPTGIFDSSSVSFTGKGTAVAVLDSGFDCDHTVFSTMPSGDVLITPQDVAKILGASVADKLAGGVELADVYVNKKIPFAFDYADKDTDVYPYDSEHGTHVSGIIGGKDDTITGVAVDTQLVLMKVFPDLDEGGSSEDILAALEDAVLLGVDAINMSLGSSCGFARESDADATNAIYDKINASGISLVTAGSNSYSSAFGGAQGSTGKVTNPDTGTVGSPSTYDSALSVASISGVKSRYLIGNGSQVVFFNESNSISGDANNFYDELRDALKKLGETDQNAQKKYDDLMAGKSIEIEYVTVPGVGMRANYTGLDVKGKIVLVRRGDNTFEDKAFQAKSAGALACIIYNNIEGDILMSMGKSDHIPTISISKESGSQLAEKESGTLSLNYSQQAGPFMSDFSSWGPTPSLGLKPEITAHGGEILSAIPGGGYDKLSGTSMASPNMCGIVVLIRQYLKEKYPDYSMKQISVMCNQMLMSTATIVQNEEGNPYSPRKQGAGLASLFNVVNTGAYLTVDGIDRTKLELGDDAKRTGVYEMSFNICNISDKDLTYKLGLVGMTETVSSSDETFVAEKGQILGGTFSATVTGDGSYDGTNVTVKAGKSVAVKLVYTLSDADKQMIDKLFPYGMYVEGFVTLESTEEKGIDLNIPFLAFYGDWTEAPMFDKTYYEVDKEAKDDSIDEEDKLKADYYATTPYGSYYYNYVIPLGTYLYDVDASAYDKIPASTDHIAISNSLGTVDGFSAVYAGLLRNAKTMTYTITDKVTGEVMKELVVENAHKAYSNGGTPIPGYEYLRWKTTDLGLVNNRQYTFTMTGTLDYGDGGVNTNKRNSFSFDFYVDNEAPVLKSVSYEKVYDKSQKKDRYYLTMVVYDNHYVQSITPIAFNSTSSYSFLSDNPIPVYGERGSDATVRFEITDYLDKLYADGLVTSALAFSIDDYALNSNIYLCQLPGTKGDFSFTKDGTPDGETLNILTIYEDEVVDLTRYLATSDKTVDEAKDYLKYLSWTSSNEKVAQVKEGEVRGMAPGRATITVEEAVELKQAVILINVKARPNSENDTEASGVSEQSAGPGGGSYSLLSIADMAQKTDSASGATISSIRFDYFNTLFAYSRSSETSEIGDTGDRTYVSALSGGGVALYPGEKIQLFYKIDPWYVSDKYEVTFSSDNEESVIVDQDGVMTALKKGSANITARVAGSNLMAYIRVTVKSEFVIDESRTLVAYKGLGGDVVIPDDEGILYIGAYAFCLYDTDKSIELPDDDYDANKIPNCNTTVTSVTIPAGVKEIRKYAFYNCTGLKTVILPDSVKIIREYAFNKDEKLTKIDLSHVELVGAYAFSGCKSLENVDFSKVYAIGVRAFENCSSLTYANLSKLRNAGAYAFRGCTNLAEVTFAEKTKLAEGMFARSGLVTVDLYTTMDIPKYCFSQCDKLTTVNIYQNIHEVGFGAFCESDALTSVNFKGTVDVIAEQAFYDCNGLVSVTLPDCPVSLSNYSFFDCDKLTTVTLGKNTELTAVNGSVFEKTSLSDVVVPAGNGNYRMAGNYLTNATGDTILLGMIGKLTGDLVIDGNVRTIGSGAFAGAKITSLTVTNPATVISDYAFSRCASLSEVNLPANMTGTIGDSAFRRTTALRAVNGLESVKSVGSYAFADSGLTSVTIGENAEYGEGAFFQSKLVSATIGKNSRFGLGAFQKCSYLTTVNMPAEGGVHFGSSCFEGDVSLSDIDLRFVDETIEAQTFYGCTKLTTANLQNVKYIGDYAFADCAALSTVLVPKVVSIGEGAFARYAKDASAPIFSRIELPDTLTTMGDGAFSGCEGLLEITLPASLTDYGDYLFAYCTNLAKVTLPANMTRIGTYSFAGCTALVAINLQNVKYIGDYAFTSCKALTNLKLGAATPGVNLPEAETIGLGAFADTAVAGVMSAPKLTKVGDYAFQNAGLTSVDAPNLTTIGRAAFQMNKSLTEFTFNPEITKIGMLAFQGCTSLRSFYATVDGQKLATYTTDDGYLNLYDGVLYTRMDSGRLQLSSVPGGMEKETLMVVEGTYRIERYAGNDNTHIKKIILPSTLKLIGNYAFYGYTSLEAVEFRSFAAPAWENEYDKEAKLTEKDPGYALLHDQFGLFGLELCYFNFIGLLGKNEPIKMILPSNSDATGYDALNYLVMFGKVSDAERSDYVAMDKTLSDFIDLAEKVGKIDKVTLGDETLINEAVTAMNALKQKGTDFGYTEEEWQKMLKDVTDAKAVLTALKLANASQAARDLQEKVNALPDTYSRDCRAAMAEIEKLLAALPASERSVLTLTKYNALLGAYRADLESGDTETETSTSTETETSGNPGNTDPGKNTNVLLIVLIACGAAVLIAAAVWVVYVMKKKKGGSTK